MFRSSMSRTRRFLGGLSLGLLNQVVMMLVGLWLTPTLLRLIGQHDYGLWLMTTQIQSYLLLLDVGVVALLPRETAYATGRAGSVEAATELPRLVGETLHLVLWQVPLVAAVCFALWRFLPPEWEGLRGPLRLTMVCFAATFPLRILHAVLQGLQDLSFLGTVQLVTYLLGNAVTIGLVFAGYGLESLAIGWVVGQVAAFACQGYRLWTRFPTVLPRRLPSLTWSAAWSWLTKSGWVSAAQVAQVLLGGTDLLVIGKLMGPAATVPYACTLKLVNVLANQPNLIMQSAGPALSEIKAGQDRGRVRDVTSSLTLATLLLSGGVAAVVLAVTRGFVGWWVGPGQFGGEWLVALVSLNMLLRHWNTTAVFSIFCFGYERRISLVVLADGLVTAAATALGVWRLGLIGAPLGSLAGACLVSLPGNLGPLAKETGVPVSGLVRGLWPWFWRFAVVAALAAGFSLSWVPGTFVQLGVVSAAVGLVYGAMVLPVALRPPLAGYLRPRAAALLSRLTGGRWQPGLE